MGCEGARWAERGMGFGCTCSLVVDKVRSCGERKGQGRTMKGTADVSWGVLRCRLRSRSRVHEVPVTRVSG